MCRLPGAKMCIGEAGKGEEVQRAGDAKEENEGFEVFATRLMSTRPSRSAFVSAVSSETRLCVAAVAAAAAETNRICSAWEDKTW